MMRLYASWSVCSLWVSEDVKHLNPRRRFTMHSWGLLCLQAQVQYRWKHVCWGILRCQLGRTVRMGYPSSDPKSSWLKPRGANTVLNAACLHLHPCKITRQPFAGKYHWTNMWWDPIAVLCNMRNKEFVFTSLCYIYIDTIRIRITTTIIILKVILILILII